MKKRVVYYLVPFLLFLFVYWMFGIMRMPAEDMKASISKGDMLLYRKFLLFPNHGDVVVYRSDYYADGDSAEDVKYLFVQRVIGLPGDTILIDSSKVYVNHQLEKTNDSYQKNYIIQLTDSIEKFKYLDSALSEKAMISKKMEYAVSMSERMYWQLKKDTNVTGITYELEFPAIFENDVFPYNENLKWNKHFWGPFYLPKKGDKIKMDKHHLSIYLPVIKEEEKLIDVRNDSLFVKGQYTGVYQFTHDYYFVMGDNRDNAIDSRYFGPVKRKDIVGVVFAIWQKQ